MVLTELSSQLHYFLKARPIMDEANNPAMLGEMLASECDEFCTSLAATQSQEIRHDPAVIYELADVIIFCLNLMQKLGVNTDTLDVPMALEAPQDDLIASMCSHVWFIREWAQKKEQDDPATLITTILSEAVSLVHNSGVDAQGLCLSKVKFNRQRYTANRFQRGLFKEARVYCKNRAISKNLEPEFYKEYLENLRLYETQIS